MTPTEIGKIFRDETGRVLMPAEFLSVAEPGGLVAAIDNLLLFRCVQIVRRLASQDRTSWDQDLIGEAMRTLGAAFKLRRPGPYQVQAAIAALHAEAACYEQTDWPQIRLLYDQLQAMTPSPVVLLNRAVATRYALGPAAALAEVEPLAAELDGYRLFHALRAGLLTALGREGEAGAATERALALAANPAERELLARGIAL